MERRKQEQAALTEELQKMELEDVNDDIPLTKLIKLLKLPIIIDEEVRKALTKIRDEKLDKIEKEKQNEKDLDHFIEKYRKNAQRIEKNFESLQKADEEKKIEIAQNRKVLQIDNKPYHIELDGTLTIIEGVNVEKL